MPWFKTDDGFWRHRKVRKLGREKVSVPALVACAGLWQLAGSWAAENIEQTDGFVPWDVIEDWDSKRALAARLLISGLWEHAEHDGEMGIRYHDWPDYNPSAAQVTAERAAAAERMRKVRSVRGRSQRSSPERSGEQEPNEHTNDTGTFGVGSASPNPSPTVPTEQSARVARTRTRGVEPPNAGDAVAAWVEGMQANGTEPTKTLRGQAARAAKELLDAGNDPDRVVAASRQAGRKGFAGIDREFAAMNGRRLAPVSGATQRRDPRTGRAVDW